MPIWLSPIKTIIEILGIVLIIVSLRIAQKSTEAAQSANKLSREALAASYVPLLKLTEFSITEKGDTTSFHYVVKNFSQNGPALMLKIHSMKPKLDFENYLFSHNALMPGESGSFTLSIESKTSKAAIELIRSGTASVRISLSCIDMFGSSHEVEQELKWFDGIFRVTEFTMKDHRFQN